MTRSSPALLVIRATLLAVLAGVGAAAETDLSVGWIERLPKIDYVWASSDPAVEGWPGRGETVTWVAHVRNLGRRRLGAVEYQWLLDGKVVAEGEATLHRNRTTRFELDQRWRRRRRELVFEIDPRNRVAELEERNNRLLVHTDALAVGIWVEKRFWKTIQATVQRAAIGCTTFEDLMQRRIRQFNEMAALAVYPETPRGVLDRWRIDAVHVVPNGSLPLSPLGDEVRDWGAPEESYGVLYPDSEDRTVDMQWGFPAFATPWFSERPAWELLNDSFLHELGHARYLVDVYAWNLTREDEVGISPPPPANSYGVFHTTPEHGLMNTSWGYIDRYSAIALNLIAGHRATEGNYNEPSNIGSFLADLPAETYLRIRTPDGASFPGRSVRLYRSSGAPDPDWMSNPYRLMIDGEPDLELETDDEGGVLLAGNPFSDDRLVLEVHRNNTLAIVELIDGGTSRWGYLEARELNLAYWRGETERATLDLWVDAPVCPTSGLGPDDVQPSHWQQVESRRVTFEWATRGSRRFEFWYVVDGRRPRRRLLEADPDASYVSKTLELRRGRQVSWWVVYLDDDRSPLCPRFRTTIYFFELPELR